MVARETVFVHYRTDHVLELLSHDLNMPSLADDLRAAESRGQAGGAVLDLRSKSNEPVGRDVELTVAGKTLRFYWGERHELGTAAYWCEQTRRRSTPATYALGDDLREEVVACLLGGYGVPAAVGLAAFEAVRGSGLLERLPSAAEVEAILREPMVVRGRPGRVRYRFARQRAGRLAACLVSLDESVPPVAPIALRDWLTGLPGVGPKTASWIVRNRTGSDDVAIIDVHVHRAGLAAGFFHGEWQLPRDYAHFESAFCLVARIAGVRAAALDACIWDQLQHLGRARSLLFGCN